MSFSRLFHQFASPPHFYRLASIVSPWLATVSIVLILGGLYTGLVLAPADYQQGEAVRIIYVHVPSAYLSMLAYVVMAVTAAIGFIWRIKLAHAVAASAAPLGAAFTLLALVTGALWGKPMWGTYWQWGDARLVSELLLLFLYLGYIALRAAFDDTDRADRTSAILAIVGVVNIPIIHFSVEWWTTLHQGPTITKFAEPSITWNMLYPLLLMIAGFTCYFGWVLLLHVREAVLRREQHTQWVRQMLAEQPR